MEPAATAGKDGAFFYGNAIPDSIPDAAVFVPGSLRIYLQEFYNRNPAERARLGMSNLPGRSGAPSFAEAIPVSAGSGWKGLPDSWEAPLRLGTARGVAFDGDAPSSGSHTYRAANVNNSGVIVGRWKV